MPSDNTGTMSKRHQSQLEGFPIGQRSVSLGMIKDDCSGLKCMKYVKIHEFIMILDEKVLVTFGECLYEKSLF